MSKLLPSCQDFLFGFPLSNKNESQSAAIFIMYYVLALELLGLRNEGKISVSYTFLGSPAQHR